MNRIIKNLFVLGAVVTLAACATAPEELVQARETYKAASENQMVRENAPAELREAELALKKAEEEFEDEGDELSTRSKAYIAEREARIAMAIAKKKQAVKDKETARNRLLETTEQSRQDAKEAYRGAQVEVYMTKAELERERAQYDQAKAEADKLNADLEAAKKSGQYSAQQLADLEKELTLKQQNIEKMSVDLQAAEAETARLAEELQGAQDKLAAFAQVKRDQENMIITLNGSVLFKTGESALMPIAQERLIEVANVLVKQKGKPIVVQGHTDSKGSDEDNMKLSQLRAEAVRTYLVSQGVPDKMIRAQGMGESMPIADNSTPEGRANNRRVEIIVSSAKATTTAAR